MRFTLTLQRNLTRWTLRRRVISLTLSFFSVNDSPAQGLECRSNRIESLKKSARKFDRPSDIPHYSCYESIEPASAVGNMSVVMTFFCFRPAYLRLKLVDIISCALSPWLALFVFW